MLKYIKPKAAVPFVVIGSLFVIWRFCVCFPSCIGINLEKIDGYGKSCIVCKIIFKIA